MSDSKKPDSRPVRRQIQRILILVALLAAILIIKRVVDRDCGGCDDADSAAAAADVDIATVIPDWADDVGEVDTAALPTSGPVELLVNLADDRDDLEAELEGRYGFDLLLNSVHADDDNLFTVTVDAARAPGLLAELSRTTGVETAEANLSVEAFGYEPNDPLYMFQWHFDQVNAEQAWDLASGEGITVAIIDTGVAYEEGRKGRKRGVAMPDLEDTGMVEGYDFVDNDSAPYDQHGHGTHVAGTVAQSTNNDYGVAGLAWAAEIMPLRVLDNNGRGSFSDVADAIRFAADNDADVINLSLGSFVPSRDVEKAIAYAHKQGVVVIAAAGNSGTRVRSYPAAFKHVIAVAATQYDRSTTFYSNYGKYIDVAAPGGNVLVDQNDDGKPDGVMQETLARTRDGQTDYKPAFALYMGTSMAAPHVAAVAALIMEQGVTDPDEVERILKESADNPKGKGWNERHGHGIIDAFAAVKMAGGEATCRARCGTASYTSLSQGLFRSGLAVLFAFLLLTLLRRNQHLELDNRPGVAFSGGLALGAGLLFALPLVLGATGLLGAVTSFIGSPVVTWDRVLLGVQTPLFASILPTLIMAGLFLGSTRGRHATAGFAIGSGAVLLVEALGRTADVVWLPGVFDNAWLLINGAASLLLGYVAMKRS